MITILPSEKDNVITLTCLDDEKEKGYINFTIDGYIGVIKDIVVYSIYNEKENDEKIVFESLLKAMGSYILNRSCFYIHNSNKELYTKLREFGFIDKKDYQELTLNKLFNHSCNGGDIG